MKKLTVIGRGTAGSLGVAHFNQWSKWEIDWIYDPSIPARSVGEGANLVLPHTLLSNLNFQHYDLEKINGTFKYGIRKINWGKEKNDFIHTFPPPAVSYHFNANKLQDYYLNNLKKSPKVNIIEKNIKDISEVDSDYILQCDGVSYNKEDFFQFKSIPVNSAYLAKCDWDYPRFNYTLTIARPYGWVFGIPLTDGCSIGYLFNSNLNKEKEIKEDIKEIFKQFNLIPSSTPKVLPFTSYYRKNNFKDNIVYNGNASFFIEPLEATSIQMIDKTQRIAYDYWNDSKYLHTHANLEYKQELFDIELMISLHYLAGSSWDTEFWEMAKDRAYKIISQNKNKAKFRNIIKNYKSLPKTLEFGTWVPHSFEQNIKGLLIQKELEKIFK